MLSLKDNKSTILMLNENAELKEFMPILMVTYSEQKFLEAKARFIVTGGGATTIGASQAAYDAYIAVITAYMIWQRMQTLKRIILNGALLSEQNYNSFSQSPVKKSICITRLAQLQELKYRHCRIHLHGQPLKEQIHCWFLIRA